LTSKSCYKTRTYNPIFGDSDIAATQRQRIRQEVEVVTETLRKVSFRLDALENMVLPENRDQVISVANGILGVRGSELGILRQAVGLDEDLALRNRQLRGRRP
jgi:hypothetical protein